MVKLSDLLNNLNGNYLLYYRLHQYIPKYWLCRIKGQRLNMEAQETDTIITKLQTCNENKFIIIYICYLYNTHSIFDSKHLSKMVTKI